MCVACALENKIKGKNKTMKQMNNDNMPTACQKETTFQQYMLAFYRVQ